MKYAVLAKICAQISIYFQKAFDASAVNPEFSSYDGGKFINVMRYHAKYYMAMAY